MTVTVGISLQYLVQEHYNIGSAVTAGGNERLICSVVLTQITSVTKEQTQLLYSSIYRAVILQPLAAIIL